MRDICRQEGVDADDEALAVLAQSGEGSVRDSLSALDQAIACCGNKLDAAQVRALLGAFGIDAMAQVTTALAAQDGSAMLAIVDELERNGGSPQHFSRELSRYLRNLLVTKISGGNSRLVTASPAEKEELARIAASFSEEDLTRYLQLSLDLFRDLQFSMQPRFHLEIGLLKMVQAGKLVPIEEALASVRGGTSPSTPPAPPSAPAPPRQPTLPPRTAMPLQSAPSPAPRASAPPPASAAAAAPAANAGPPSPDEDWREKLQSAMTKAGLQFSADAMGQSNASLVNNELIIQAPKQFQLDLGREEILTALKQLGHPTLRFKVVFGEVTPSPSAKPVPKAAPPQDEVTERALNHPDVQRFRELFGGEVRNVRNLKES
jgi:DNA polymerase-3 subunit gamma/tau